MLCVKGFGGKINVLLSIKSAETGNCSDIHGIHDNSRCDF